tara:strand:+ start:432 stop:644 length:213 start_codon:yes stop_codon:yes gene_type:complete
MELIDGSIALSQYQWARLWKHTPIGGVNPLALYSRDARLKTRSCLSIDGKTYRNVTRPQDAGNFDKDAVE